MDKDIKKVLFTSLKFYTFLALPYHIYKKCYTFVVRRTRQWVISSTSSAFKTV